MSDSRKFFVAKNTGLSRTDPKYWSLDKVAKKFKLKSPNPVVVLSKHISARGVNLRAVANGGQDVREELRDTREVANDENEVTPVLRSGRVGNSGRKPLTDLQRSSARASRWRPWTDPDATSMKPRLRILKPQVICSGDETDMSMVAAPKKSKKERGLFLSSSIDTRDVAATKVGRKISWFYGRTGTGKLSHHS